MSQGLGILLVDYVFECQYLSYHYGQMSPYVLILGPHILKIKYAYNDYSDDVDDDDDDDEDDDDDDNDDNYDNNDDGNNNRNNNNDNDYDHDNNNTDNDNDNYEDNDNKNCSDSMPATVFTTKLHDIINIVGILMATMSCHFCMKCLF